MNRLSLSHRKRWMTAALLVLVLVIFAALVRFSSALPQRAGQPAVGEPAVLYRSPSYEPEIWITSMSGSAPRQLTFTGGRIFDYNISSDALWIVYSVQNEQKGIDIWEMDRQGGQARLILPCSADWCINPAYSPDGKKIAYSRRIIDLEGAEPGVPRIWMLDRSSGSTQAIYANPNIGGFGPAWSPNGQFLMFFDGLSHGVRVFNINSQTDFFFESQSGMVGKWSPDSQQILYMDYLPGETLPYSIIYRVDVQTQQAQSFLGDDLTPVDYSMPAWSPDGAWLAFAMRAMSGSPSKQLWLMRSDGSQRQSIIDDPLFTYTAYEWSPDGKMLLFQRLELGASASRPQIALWNREAGEVKVLAEDASHPRWLP